VPVTVAALWTSTAMPELVPLPGKVIATGGVAALVMTCEPVEVTSSKPLRSMALVLRLRSSIHCLEASSPVGFTISSLMMMSPALRMISRSSFFFSVSA